MRSLVAIGALTTAACGRIGFGADAGGDGDGARADARADGVPVTGTVSCAGIRNGDPGSASGVYVIDPDEDGPFGSIEAYCDMVTDGGGWTLVLSYVHRNGTTPALSIRTGGLPLLGSEQLGVDESGTATWGHAAPVMVARLPASQLRFTCRSSAHARVLDFTTDSPQCLDYLRTGTGGCFDLRDTFAALPGHTAMLPAQMTHIITEAGDLAATENPFYKNTMPKANWAIDSGGSWECDAQASGAMTDTIHRVWVR